MVKRNNMEEEEDWSVEEEEVRYHYGHFKVQGNISWHLLVCLFMWCTTWSPNLTFYVMWIFPCRLAPDIRITITIYNLILFKHGGAFRASRVFMRCTVQ